ncbi:MAG: hypothetical protein EZS28_002429 [Streblomastix strix]|uniref:Dual specificity phosphatase catalytic domain-containing protein n=1 Tax=Streblomastix strix TaxID=222440 RepID=A0A5J4X498_9EUKA|nr:MAG: hypothetical protein EZS28_002429 [Streblomastix strix]
MQSSLNTELPTTPVSRLRDYIFFGSVEAALSEEFIYANKITRVINCAGGHIVNKFSTLGIKYLTFFLLDEDNSQFIDFAGTNPRSVQTFIDAARDDCENVLIVSVKGRSRCLLVGAAFLMTKFNYSSEDAIEFVSQVRKI